MEQVSACGNYPANLIYDVTQARDKLKDEYGFINSDFVLVCHNKTDRVFEYRMYNTNLSYRDFLINQGILSRIAINNNLEEDCMYIYATRDGFPITKQMECLEVIVPESIFKITHITIV